MDYFLWTEKSNARNLLTNKYEPLQPFLFLSFLEFANADTMIDIGANVGFYSFISTLCPSIRSVYSFEPDNSAFIELKNNVTLNNLEEKIRPFKLAVSDKKGTVNFGSHSPMSGVNGILESSIHEQSLFNEFYPVSTIKLDSISELNGRTLGIKIDVEGHELKVIEGAVKILKNNPSIIQIEHYVGGEIDKKLKGLGFFNFFSAGHDYYYSNIRNFLEPSFVNRALSYASSWLVETSSGRLPERDTIKFCLTSNCELKNSKVNAQALLKPNFFVEPEYAFYLMVDGEKAEQQWYSESNFASFNAPDSYSSIEIIAFVREKNNNNKKITATGYVDKPVTGYRPDSAVSESYKLPNEYLVTANHKAREFQGFSDLNIEKLLFELSESRCKKLVLICDDALAFEILYQIKSEEILELEVIFFRLCDNPLNNKIQLLIDQLPIKFKIADISSISEERSLLKRDDNQGAFVVLRSQALVHMHGKLSQIEYIVSLAGTQGKVFSEELSDSSFKSMVKKLCQKNSIECKWLELRSTITNAVATNAEDQVSSKDKKRSLLQALDFNIN
ncbi:FkbM family methyltransferase [Alteromonas macleodii]